MSENDHLYETEKDHLFETENAQIFSLYIIWLITQYIRLKVCHTESYVGRYGFFLKRTLF